jgi:hypothetical protein
VLATTGFANAAPSDPRASASGPAVPEPRASASGPALPNRGLQPAGPLDDDDDHDDEEGRKKWTAGKDAPEPGTRELPWLHFVNLYTMDVLPVFGKETSIKSFDRLSRCRATGKSVDMDPRLPKVMLAAAEKLKGSVIEVLSGYRSEKFNEQLRKKGHEVASESFHRKGLAVDWRVRNVPLRRLVAWLKRRHQGGLGIYRQSNFVHTDTGPKRDWRGR